MSEDNRPLKDRITELLKQGKNNEEIKSLTNANRSYIYKLRAKFDKATEKEKTQPSAVEATEIEAPATDEVIAAETPEDRVGSLLPESATGIAPALLKGYFEQDDVKGIFDAVNELLPNEFQRNDRQLAIVSKLWVKPANRILAKYLDENVDIYIAVAVTLLVFAPAIYGVARKALKPQPTKPIEKKPEEAK